MKREYRLLASGLFLSVMGLIASIYLAWQHYSPSPHPFCDFGGRISCSLVNNSVYSEIFGVPVAFFGVLWFSVSFFLSCLALSKRKKAPAILLAWSVIGALFALYLIYIELILQAVCPFCFAVQAIVFSTLVISLIIVRKQ